MTAPRWLRSACRRLIRPRRSEWSRRCRSEFSAVIASGAKQSISSPGSVDCFAALAMTVDCKRIWILESDMKRFNLSGWAVSHPTLILFLMIVLGAAGFFSYERLGRAEDPFFT